jgi:ribosomal protein S18 acetylase RimI-like enzyme
MDESGMGGPDKIDEPDGVSFRIAKEEDFDFVWEGRLDIARADDYTIPDVEKDRERVLSAINAGKVLLALAGGEPAGFLWFTISDKFPYGVSYGSFGSKYAFVDYVYVHPSRRRQGLGTRLYNGLGELCRKRGIGEIILDVMEINENSRKFHKKAGFAPFVTLYSRKV